MQLQKTTTDKRHYHVVFLADDGTGQASPHLKNGHTHEVAFSESKEAIMSMDGDKVLEEATEAGYEILPGGKDNHTHTITPLETKSTKKKETPEKKARDIIHLWREAREGEKESRKKGLKSEDYVQGEQWDTAMKAKLESQKRAALTINEIEPKIDLLCGHQRQNRTDIRYYPLEDGDARIADILNVLVKNITDGTDFEYCESEAFEDMTITGRGLLNVYVDYDKNIHGDIVIERYPWKDVYFGPHDKKDLSDCEYLCKSRWMSEAKIKSLWPEKSKDIGKAFGTYGEEVDDRDEPHKNRKGTQYAESTNTSTVTSSASITDLVDITKKEFRVIECWRKEYKKVPVIVNVAADFYHNGEDMSESDVSAVKAMQGFKVVYRKIHKMRVTKIAGETFLEDGFPDLAVDDFYIIPLYAKKNGDKWWGKVEAVKGMQDEINKRHSQTVDILNKVATYGYFFDGQTFLSPADVSHFKKNSSTPGFVQKLRDSTKPPTKMEGVKFPAEIVQLEAMASQKMNEIMNVPPDMAGMNPTGESGVAIMEMKQAGLTGNGFLFDSLSFAKKRLGRMLVAIIQDVYTPERIARVLQGRLNNEKIEVGGLPVLPPGGQAFEAAPPPMPPQMPAGMPPQEGVPTGPPPAGPLPAPPLSPPGPPGMPPGAAGPPPGAAGAMMGGPQMPPQEPQRVGYTLEEITELLEEADLTKYDVAVGESAFNPTTKRANFLVWAELARNGQPVPPTLLVDLSDLPEKDRVKVEIEKMMMQSQQAEQAKQQTEIQKTVIAKGDGGQAPPR